MPSQLSPCAALNERGNQGNVSSKSRLCIGLTTTLISNFEDNSTAMEVTVRQTGRKSELSRAIWFRVLQSRKGQRLTPYTRCGPEDPIAGSTVISSGLRGCTGT